MQEERDGPGDSAEVSLVKVWLHSSLLSTTERDISGTENESNVKLCLQIFKNYYYKIYTACIQGI